VLAQAAGDPAVRPAQLQVLVVLATRLDSGEWVPVPAASVAAHLGMERASVARALQRVARELEQVLDAELPRPVSHAQLARDLGVSRGSVQAGIEQLVATGALLRGPRAGRTYTYRLPNYL